MTEDKLQRLTGTAARAIGMGLDPGLALAALETHLSNEAAKDRAELVEASRLLSWAVGHTECYCPDRTTCDRARKTDEIRAFLAKHPETP